MIHRRDLILAAAGSAAAAPAAARTDAPSAPSLEFLAEMTVRIGPRRDVVREGEVTRSVIPITGGAFEGPRLRGVVLSGESRHTDRPGGRFLADVTYRLRTDDGVEIEVAEHAVIDAAGGRPPHGFNALRMTAPDGPYAWLNRCIVVGTLNVELPPDVPPVVKLRLFALR